MGRLGQLHSDMRNRFADEDEVLDAATRRWCSLRDVLAVPGLQHLQLPGELRRGDLDCLGILLTLLWNWLTDQDEIPDAASARGCRMRSIFSVPDLQHLQLPSELC